MKLRSIFSFLSGRRLFRKKGHDSRTLRRRSVLQFEELESRFTPATFATIDSFSGATLGDVTTNSGGTGFAGNIVVSNTIDLDQGVDEDLQTAPEVGAADAAQLADTRTVDLDYTSVLAGTVAVTTNSGFIDFNSAANASANMEISYTLPIDVVLSDDTITFDISGFNPSTGGLPTPFTLAINGTDVDTQLVGGNGTFTFDETLVDDFLGQQITSISLKMVGGLGNDLNILDFAGTFSTVDAQIDLEPLTATNEVGQEHTVTAIVQQDDGLPAGAPGDGADGFGPAPDGTEVLFVITNNGTDAALDDTADENNDGIFDNDEIVTTVNGEAPITFVSTTAGSVDIHATTTFSIGGIEVTRETDGLGENSGDANKLYVNAQIDLDPLTDTNPVNEEHTVTATVQQDDGIAAADGGDGVDGFGPAPDGTEVLFVITNTGTDAALDDTADENNDGIFDNDEIVTTVGGDASITFVSTTAGTVDIHASTSFDVEGVTLTRETDGLALNSEDAEKLYIAPEAQIDLDPLTDTNPVNEEHTVTATVQQDDGLDAGQGGDGVTGFTDAPDGTEVLFVITNTGTDAALDDTADENNDGIFDNDEIVTTVGGDASITFVSTTGGTVDIHATTTFTVSGVELTVATGTGGLNSDDAEKLYVAPEIQIDLDPLTATNQVNEEHTVTATVQQDDGLDAGQGGDGVTGFTDAPDGTEVLFVITNNGTDATLDAAADENNDGIFDNDEIVTTVGGEASITFVSSTAGTVDIHATTTFTVSGVELTAATGTGGLNSDDAEKIYEAPKVTRTQGFWQTHTAFTKKIFDDELGGSITIGNKVIDSYDELFSGFLSGISKTSTKGKRDADDQARMILLQQLLAAILNDAAFGSSSATQDLISDASSQFCTASKSQLLTWAGQLDAYNNSGDDGAIPAALGSPGKATPKDSQALAGSVTGKTFWDDPC